MSESHSSPSSLPKNAVHFGVLGAVVLVALIYQFGYPLLILVADFAALAGIALIVGLTALDLQAQKKPARLARAPAAGEAAAQAA